MKFAPLWSPCGCHLPIFTYNGLLSKPVRYSQHFPFELLETPLDPWPTRLQLGFLILGAGRRTGAGHALLQHRELRPQTLWELRGDAGPELNQLLRSGWGWGMGMRDGGWGMGMGDGGWGMSKTFVFFCFERTRWSVVFVGRMGLVNDWDCRLTLKQKGWIWKDQQTSWCLPIYIRCLRLKGCEILPFAVLKLEKC